jgi:hypothetical protein
MWKWETAGQFSKLLGFFFGDTGIDPGLVLQNLTANLNAQLRKARQSPFQVMDRVILIKHLFGGFPMVCGDLVGQFR